MSQEHGEDNSRIDRRRFLAATSGVALSGLTAGCAGIGGSGGGDYPSEDITFIVPYSSGGGYDAYTRLAAPYWEEYLPNDVGTEVVNRPGGGGVLGMNEAYTADSDGHTMIFWDVHGPVEQQIGQDVTYDVREMTAVGLLTHEPNSIVITADALADDAGWDEFVDNINELDFATQGVGSPAHLTIVFLGALTGAFTADDVNFVHYGGTSEALGGIEKGEANAMGGLGIYSAGKVIAALDSVEERLFVFSDEETASDVTDTTRIFASNLDVDNIEQYGDLTAYKRSFFGPPEVPDEILETQRSAFMEIIEDEEFLSEAQEAQRPVNNPAGHEAVRESIESKYETLTSEPYRSILQDNLG